LPFPTVKVQLATPPENLFSSCAHFFIMCIITDTQQTLFAVCQRPNTQRSPGTRQTVALSWAKGQCKHAMMLVVFHLSAHGEHVRTCPPCAHRHYRKTSVCRAYFQRMTKKKKTKKGGGDCWSWQYIQHGRIVAVRWRSVKWKTLPCVTHVEQNKKRNRRLAARRIPPLPRPMRRDRPRHRQAFPSKPPL
jgi:hypothetical protein